MLAKSTKPKSGTPNSTAESTKTRPWIGDSRSSCQVKKSLNGHIHKTYQQDLKTFSYYRTKNVGVYNSSRTHFYLICALERSLQKELIKSGLNIRSFKPVPRGISYQQEHDVVGSNPLTRKKIHINKSFLKRTFSALINFLIKNLQPNLKLKEILYQGTKESEPHRDCGRCFRLWADIWAAGSTWWTERVEWA